jgi:superfamily I DNA/RNA helicase
MRFTTDSDTPTPATATATIPTPAPTPRPARSERKRLEGTEQQENFWHELRTGSNNISLSARAGTGKSTSCREGMYRILEDRPRAVIRYCCFNKKIAEEFSAKSPKTADVGTMHSFGLQALGAACKPQVDQKKSYAILDGLGGSELKGYYRRAIVKVVSLAKNHALRPGDELLPVRLDELVDRFSVECYRQRNLVIDRAQQVLEASAAMTALVDYDDMIWLPVLMDLSFPTIDLLFIDECQDLNPIQHELARLLSNSGRTIIVGDPFQSIYAFRGADSESIPKLQEKLGATVMPLTVSFRCPRRHVDLARELVADFEAAPQATDGRLEFGRPYLIDECGPGHLVVCRANAPLIGACLRKIANRVPAIVRGRSIGDTLLSVVRRLNDPLTIPDFTRMLEDWRYREILRLEAKDGADDLIEQTEDRAACLHAIASACQTPTEIPGLISRLFKDDEAQTRVTFSTVHRAKGSEAENVTFINIPYSATRDALKAPQPWELDQRRNLRYVALTRSLHSLTIVSGKDDQ